MLANRIRAFFAALLIGATVDAAAVAQGFEAAEVRLNRSGATDGSIGLEPGGRLVVRNSTLREIVLIANYSLSKRLIDLLGSELVAGGPTWIDSDRFDIVAKAEGNASPAIVRLMLQAILTERFHLACHHEARPLRAYALRAGARPKLLKSPTDGAAGCEPGNSGDRQIHRICHNMTMAELAAALPGMASYYIDLPVVDLTGLAGAYDFRLDWAPTQRAEGGIGGPPVLGDAGGATMFDAIGRLGLKLEEGKYPVGVVVIDRVERLSEQ
jgi:uncharacterized protein (TIGR03435 family)